MEEVKSLLEKYKSYSSELNDRLDELSEKNLWGIYHDREIHLRYVNELVEDLENILTHQ